MKRVLVFILTIFFLYGCGGNVFQDLASTDTWEAKREAAKIALDNGDYATAISILQSLCGTDPASLSCDVDTQADLASAYVARAAQLDVLTLIQTVENTQNTQDIIASFQNVSTLLPISDINNCASNGGNCTMVDDLNKAITILDNILPDQIPQSPTGQEKDLYLQLAVASAVDVAVRVGIISGGLDENTGLPSVQGLSAGDISDTDLNRITTDVDHIALGLEGAGITDSSISQNINTIETELKKQDGDPTSVSKEDIALYINSL